MVPSVSSKYCLLPSCLTWLLPPAAVVGSHLNAVAASGMRRAFPYDFNRFEFGRLKRTVNREDRADDWISKTPLHGSSPLKPQFDVYKIVGIHNPYRLREEKNDRSFRFGAAG